MKKWLTLLIIAMFTVVLGACGNDDKDDQDNTNNTEKQEASDTGTTHKDENDKKETNKNEDNSDMKKEMDELDYSDFELEVSYGNDQEYEAEIEQKSGKIQADLEDEINGMDVNGQEAFDNIYPKVKKLNVDRDTEKTEVIKQVLEAFELEDDYQKFEVEFKFKDGTKLSFEDRK